MEEETLTCFCTQCQTVLGRFVNSWYGIGKTYNKPVKTEHSSGLVASGKSWIAEQGSSIAGSELQSLVCRKCKMEVGLRCKKSSTNILRDGENILRLSKLRVISDLDDEDATISVLKTFPLNISNHSHTDPSQKPRPKPDLPKPGLTSRDAPPKSKQNIQTELSISQNKVRSHRLSYNGEAASSDSADQPEWLKNAISSQQNDIDRVTATVNRIEKDMQDFKAFMIETRETLTQNYDYHGKNHAIKTIVDSQARQKGEIEEFREQISQMSESLEARTDIRLQQPGINNVISSSHLDVLTESIMEATLKANKVDVLKTELQFLKERIKALENVELRPRTSGSQSPMINSPHLKLSQSNSMIQLATRNLALAKGNSSKQAHKNLVRSTDMEDAENLGATPRRVAPRVEHNTHDERSQLDDPPTDTQNDDYEPPDNQYSSSEESNNNKSSFTVSESQIATSIESRERLVGSIERDNLPVSNKKVWVYKKVPRSFNRGCLAFGMDLLPSWNNHTQFKHKVRVLEAFVNNIPREKLDLAMALRWGEFIDPGMVRTYARAATSNAHNQIPTPRDRLLKSSSARKKKFDAETKTASTEVGSERGSQGVKRKQPRSPSIILGEGDDVENSEFVTDFSSDSSPPTKRARKRVLKDSGAIQEHEVERDGQDIAHGDSTDAQPNTAPVVEIEHPDNNAPIQNWHALPENLTVQSEPENPVEAVKRSRGRPRKIRHSSPPSMQLLPKSSSAENIGESERAAALAARENYVKGMLERGV